MTVDFKASIVHTFNTERNEWTAEIERAKKAPPALVGRAYVVVDADLTNGLQSEGTRWHAVYLTPGLPGVSAWDRKQAEKIAAAIGNGWRAVRAGDVPAERVQVLDSLLTYWSA